jgi:hypothetical protein
VQFDFKDVTARIAGVDVALHMYVARLSYSTAFFARCYLVEDRPALFDGLTLAALLAKVFLITLPRRSSASCAGASGV